MKIILLLFKFLLISFSLAAPLKSQKRLAAGKAVTLREVSSHFYPLDGFEETTRQLFSKGRKHPLKWNNYNPLSTHNATLDDQYALRNWFLWFHTLDTKTLNFRFMKLLENPTVDFSCQNYRALKEIARLGNLGAVKELIERIPIELDERDQILKQTVVGAAYSQNKDLVRFLVNDLKISPNSDAVISAVKTGNLDITKLLLGKMDTRSNDFIRVFTLTKYLAESTGNQDLIDFIEDLRSPETKMPNNNLSKSPTVFKGLYKTTVVQNTKAENKILPVNGRRFGFI